LTRSHCDSLTQDRAATLGFDHAVAWRRNFLAGRSTQPIERTDDPSSTRTSHEDEDVHVQEDAHAHAHEEEDEHVLDFRDRP
jgi:hypothetical protein